MSDTYTLSGESDFDGIHGAMFINSERQNDPTLSYEEHEILAGIEADLISGNDDALGVVLTSAIVGGGAALKKSGALKKVGGFLKKGADKIADRIRKRRAKRRGGKATPEESNDLEALKAIQAVRGKVGGALKKVSPKTIATNKKASVGRGRALAVKKQSAVAPRKPIKQQSVVAQDVYSAPPVAETKTGMNPALIAGIAVVLFLAVKK